MTKPSPFRYFKTSPEIIRLAVMMYVRFPLSLRNVEDLLHERGIDVSHETVRYWWNRLGLVFASEIRRKRVERLRLYSEWKWHIDELFVKINGKRHYPWRGRSRRRGAGIRCHETEKQARRIEVPQETDEAAWSGQRERDRSPRLLQGSLSRARCCRQAADGQVAQYPGREFTLTTSTTRAGNAMLPTHAKSPEARRRPFLGLQPFQPRAQPHQPRPLQGGQDRRSCRVA